MITHNLPTHYTSWLAHSSMFEALIASSKVIAIWIPGGIVASIMFILTTIVSKKLGLGNLNSIVLIGSYITGDAKKGIFTGVKVCLGIGSLWASACGDALHILAQEFLWPTPLLGSLVGFINGLLLSPGLLTTLADFHPSQIRPQPSRGDIGIDILSHTMFGCMLGLYFGLLRLEFRSFPLLMLAQTCVISMTVLGLGWRTLLSLKNRENAKSFQFLP